MSEKEDKSGNGTLLVLKVMELLSSFPATGARNIDIATSLGISPVAVTRAVKVLERANWARVGEFGLIYPTVNFARMTFRLSADLAAAKQRLEDLKQNMMS